MFVWWPIVPPKTKWSHVVPQGYPVAPAILTNLSKPVPMVPSLEGHWCVVSYNYKLQVVLYPVSVARTVESQGSSLQHNVYEQVQHHGITYYHLSLQIGLHQTRQTPQKKQCVVW